jgi:hypothetical protein
MSQTYTSFATGRPTIIPKHRRWIRNEGRPSGTAGDRSWDEIIENGLRISLKRDRIYLKKLFSHRGHAITRTQRF